MRNRKLIASLAITALFLCLSSASVALHADPSEYDFKPLAFLGDPAPGGGFFTNDFEPWNMNNRGEVAFGADLAMTPGGENIGEGVFVASNGLSQIARVGQPAPGGGTFDQFFLFNLPINDTGDVAFTFQLSPADPPAGINAGVYRFTRSTGKVTPVMAPGVTPVPRAGSGVFKGAFSNASMNNGGEIVFTGIVTTDKGINMPGQVSTGLGSGVFRAATNGQIVSMVSPGDPFPGGGTFDYAWVPWINDGGDIALDAHIAGQDCINIFGAPQDQLINCVGDIYFIKAGSNQMQSIARLGASAPGGGVFRLLNDPVLNNRGEIVFAGDLTPAPGDPGNRVGLFLYSGGRVQRVARPGDPMPGGGMLVTTGLGNDDFHLNNRGELTFSAALDTTAIGASAPDSGLYVWSGGSLSLVARTGTVIPEVGTIAHLREPSNLMEVRAGAFAINNDRGQVVFGAILTSGRFVLLSATPRS